MNITRSNYLFSFVLIILAAVTLASAQEGPTVEIKNSSGEKRKICAYDEDDIVNVVAKRCFTMNAGEEVLWNREGDRTSFKVKIFQSKPVLDNYLYIRTLPGDTTKIIVGTGKRFGFSRQEQTLETIKYRLRVCNSQFDETIYFTLGFETNDVFVTEGWWNVAKSECIDVAVSERLKTNWRVGYGNLPRTYYYARIYGDKPLYWKGGENDPKLCINENKAFEKKQFNTDANGNRTAVDCSAAGEAIVSFRRLEDPKTNEKYYYLTF